MTWDDFSTTAGQLGFLVALTGLVYRGLRVFLADVPEAVMQFLAAIFSSVTALVTSYNPATPRHQWLLLGIAGGVLMSQNVVKSIDWISSAATKTGAPQVGLPEQPPAWFVAALAKGATVETPEPVKPRSAAALEAQIKANEAAVAKAEVITPKRVEPDPTPSPPVPKPWED